MGVVGQVLDTMIGVAHGAVGVSTAISGSSFGRQRAGFGYCRVRCEMERSVVYA